MPKKAIWTNPGIELNEKAADFCRNARQRLWHAILPCAIRLLLLRLPHSVPAAPPPTAPDRYPLAYYLCPAGCPLCTRSLLGRSCCNKPYLPELPYTEAGPSRVCSRRRFRRGMVWVYKCPEKLGVVRMGVRFSTGKMAESEGSFVEGRSGGRWVGQVRREEKGEAEH